jgi:hypothetical protein
MRLQEIQMLSKFVNLKRHKHNGKDYYKVSDFLKTFDSSNPDNEQLIDGLKRIPHSCFINNMKYVSSQAVADMMMF